MTLPDSIRIDLKEIGLYLDGVCKGAVVVENNIEQICAYLNIGEKLTDGVVEFVFYYDPDKNSHQERRTIRMDNSRFIARYANGDNRYPYYDIALSAKDIENVVPVEFALNQNYPNPFNPTTSIRYSIDEPGSVSLDIYNIKGQLVKNLNNGNTISGSHTAIWNGLDNSGNACSSGVYFYRLRTSKTTLVRKMLMLK